jgi:hypothetical protein
MENLAIDVIFWSISQLSRHDRESFKSFKETNLQESLWLLQSSIFNLSNFKHGAVFIKRAKHMGEGNKHFDVKYIL